MKNIAETYVKDLSELVELTVRLELTTYGLQGRYATNCATPAHYAKCCCGKQHLSPDLGEREGIEPSENKTFISTKNYLNDIIREINVDYSSGYTTLFSRNQPISQWCFRWDSNP